MKTSRALANSDPHLFLRGKIWYYDFSIKGERFKGTTKLTDRDEALDMARKAKVDAFRGLAGGDFDPQTALASECFRIYRDRRMKKRTEHARKVMDSWAKRFHDRFGDVPLAGLTTFQIEDFRDWLLEQKTVSKRWKKQKTLSPKTANEILVWLSSVFKYLKIENPVVGIERPKKSKQEVLEDTIRFYTNEDMKNILKSAEGTVFRLPLRILLNTGCRPAELRYLSNTPQQIDRENQTLLFIDKRSRARGIQLIGQPFEEAWDALIEWIDLHNIKKGEKVFPQGKGWFLRRWHTVLSRAKMPKCRTHQIRHQFVKMAFYDLGWDLTTISKWCGHSTDVCYGRYSNLLIQAPRSSKGDLEDVEVLTPEVIAYDWQDRVQGEERQSAPMVRISKEEHDEYLALKNAQKEKPSE